MNSNIIMMTDGYKISQWLQLPPKVSDSFFHILSRGGKFKEIQVAGAHYLTSILARGITVEEVEEAKSIIDDYMGPGIFHYEGWMHIAKNLGGKLPIRIRSIPEGVVVPSRTVVATIETLGVQDAWLGGYLETMALRAYWYGSTVGTISYEAKKILRASMEASCDLPKEQLEAILNFRLIDFGARGVSSGESAAVGGLPHTYNFKGTDTLEAVVLGRQLFQQTAGYTIPAREHSTTTCYLREGEYEAFMNSVNEFGDGNFAVVIDSYSTKKAIKWLLTNKEFLRILTEKGGTCILRPDSGSPIEMVMLCLNEVWKHVGGTVNTLGYKVLDPRFRVIQGDGVDLEAIKHIVDWAVHNQKFAQENFSFGMGGGLLQHCDRDWSRWAMKCSSMTIDGKERGVFKSPETDPTKASLAGRLDVVIENGKYVNRVITDGAVSLENTAMSEIFNFGERKNLLTLEQVRYNTEFKLSAD